MGCMRAILASLLLAAVATPAAAQLAPNSIQLDDLRARVESIERQNVARSNEVMSQEAQTRAQSAVTDLQAQRDFPPSIPELRYEPQLPAVAPGQLKYPSVPDAALADSNKRVQAAAANRH